MLAVKNLGKSLQNSVFGAGKGKCAREGTFFANRFPSLGSFVNKNVGFRKN